MLVSLVTAPGGSEVKFGTFVPQVTSQTRGWRFGVPPASSLREARGDAGLGQGDTEGQVGFVSNPPEGSRVRRCRRPRG